MGLGAHYLKAKLLNYDFYINYVNGKSHMADFLSRLSQPSPDGKELERPGMNFSILADKQLELSSETESDKGFIGAITTRRRKKG